MDLREIVAIAGVGGLHKIIGQRASGLIVESLDEKKTRFATSATQKVSILEDIALYVEDGEMRLRDVLRAIFKKENEGGPAADPKADNEALRNILGTYVPEFDREKVYVSDIKKLFTWYNILKQNADLSALKSTEELEKEFEEQQKTKGEGAETAEAPAEKPAKTKAAPKAEGEKKKKTTAAASGKGKASAGGQNVVKKITTPRKAT